MNRLHPVTWHRPRALTAVAAALALGSAGVIASPAIASADPPLCRGMQATHVGTNGPDVIIGTSGNDVIHALGGADTVEALGGDDIICAGDGDDRLIQDLLPSIRGGDGNDLIDGGAGSDALNGEQGDDVLDGESGADSLEGSDGNDELDGDSGADVLCGDAYVSVVVGGPNVCAETLLLSGSDDLDGGPDNDTLDGGLPVIVPNPPDSGNGGGGTDTCRNLSTQSNCEP